jgi:uncharacterized protein YecE (DUF72 family)
VDSEVRTGCSSWTYPQWSGRFYPKGIEDGERLTYYARRFDCVEVDSSYYAAPNPFVVRGWDRKTPAGFLFTLKMPREFLDPKRPAPPEQVLSFVRTAESLGPKLGAILLQFAPWFKAPKYTGSGNASFLTQLLDLLPEGPRYALELRDASWYREGVVEGLTEHLERRSISLCWSALNYLDIPPIRTTGWLYVRFIGDHSTTPEESHGEIRVDRTEVMRRWSQRIREAEPTMTFAFFSNHFEGYAPLSVNRFRRELGLTELEVGPPGGRGLDRFLGSEAELPGGPASPSRS